MSDTLKSGQSTVIVGLGTWTHTAAEDGMYYVNVMASEIPDSSLSILLKKNSSTVATSVAPAAGQSVVIIKTVMNLVATDVISVVISSSAAIDNQLNSVKTIISLGRGSSA